MITPEGDYLSNLTAPDLRPFFKHLHWRKMGHSMGHLVASDWADKAVDDPVFGLYKNCGLWTRDEAAILYNVAFMLRGVRSRWLDIGAHTGWTTAHIEHASATYPYPVDPMFSVEEFRNRFCDNLRYGRDGWTGADMTSASYFQEKLTAKQFLDGVCIDGDHEPGKPLEDAQNAVRHLADTGVIMFHDFIGAPVREAVTWLMDHHPDCASFGGPAYECDCGRGFKARVYWTPHMVACCWRGDFTPPDHVGDPRINWTPHLHQMKKDFDFGRLS